jgi:hypothetical protein
LMPFHTNSPPIRQKCSESRTSTLPLTNNVSRFTNLTQYVLKKSTRVSQCAGQTLERQAIKPQWNNDLDSWCAR